MRRIMKSRCTPQHNLLAEIGGTTRRRWGDASIHRYRSELTRTGKQPVLVRVATYIGHCVNLY